MRVVIAGGHGKIALLLAALLAGRVPPGDVTRADTAAVLAALLDTPASVGKILELRNGDVEIAEAVP